MFYETVDLTRSYGLKEGKATLTVYARERRGDLAAKLRPAMLVVPGGGYSCCSDREQEPVAARFFAEGYAAFVLNYSTKTPYPVPLIEAAAAVAYIRENAERLGVDPAHVGACGFSAGGHLVGMLATLFGEPPVKAAIKGNVRPDAVVLSYPVITAERPFANEETMGNISGGDEALRRALSLETRVTKDSVPAFLWHTSTDDCVPVQNSLRMANAYAAAGVPFELHVFERGRHGLSVATAETEEDPSCLADTGNVPKWTDLAIGFLSARGFAVLPAKR